MSSRSGAALAVVNPAAAGLSEQHCAKAQPPEPGSLFALGADLTVGLAAAAPDTVELAVGTSLGQLATALQAEWAVIGSPTGTELTTGAARYAPAGRPHMSTAVSLLLDLPAIASTLESGAPVWFSSVGDVIGDDASGSVARHVRSAAIVPLPAAAVGKDRGRMALVVGSAETAHEWSPAVIELLRILGAAMSQALARKADAERQKAVPARLRWSSAGAAPRLVDGPPATNRAAAWGLVASASPAIRQALEQAEQVAGTASTVLLLGETGVGKERFARAIHELSTRSAREMVRINCAAIPATLIESELFGRERGAYTGALTRQIGRFEAASGSTLFLDEIGELPEEVQVKLLRVLEERVIERLGSTLPIKVDVRIIAATHRDLEAALAEGRIREDLFYRLNVFPIRIPPLRERPEDIPGLAWTFIDELSHSLGKPVHSIASDSMRQLMAHPWPGNIRELRNVIERAMILAAGPELRIPVPEPSGARPAHDCRPLGDVVTAHIRTVLEDAQWRIRGKGGAAERLGLKPSTLETRMAKLGIKRPRPSA
jgi:transcriptional regulator with GAF, ATPase, and Fis domain